MSFIWHFGHIHWRTSIRFLLCNVQCIAWATGVFLIDFLDLSAFRLFSIFGKRRRQEFPEWLGNLIRRSNLCQWSSLEGQELLYQQEKRSSPHMSQLPWSKTTCHPSTPRRYQSLFSRNCALNRRQWRCLWSKFPACRTPLQSRSDLELRRTPFQEISPRRIQSLINDSCNQDCGKLRHDKTAIQVQCKQIPDE